MTGGSTAEQFSPSTTDRPSGATAPRAGGTPRGAWVVWAAAATAFAIAVFHRSSMGVAALPAAERFEVGAGVVSTFVVVQLLVYSLAQLPVGVMLDRFGPRRMITIGAVLMALGQASMAVADQLGWAVAARVLVGAGDAMTFASAIRLVPAWFAPRRVPLMTQVTGLTGQFGQILSAVPLVWLLRTTGWSTSYLVAAATAVLSALVAGLLIRDHPAGGTTPRSSGRPRAGLGDVLGHPGTWLGAFTHASTVFAPMTFAMMWGFPYLTSAEGRSDATASGLLSLLVVLGVFVGPMVGFLTQRHPLRRSTLVLLVVIANALPWLMVVLWPGPAPLWLLTLWVVGLATGGPGSAVAFDFARTFAPTERLGTATGFIIMCGFAVTLATILGIGLALDAQGGSYDLQSFRRAWLVMLVPYLLGPLGIVWTRTRARHKEDLRVPTWREVWKREIGNRNWPRLDRGRRS
ncbi:Nitrate/nitrite transporter NarK [Kytococcus aerolatus]|uniref:Nitrate/nitrite transporter NarK n=1 Tax=Kytococcus aerolatus TaxID=592308 RepID=A0A212TBM6_9MICO|nr:MFS transporter [Kytococcus aerolatus]SNC63241.1 Nitrate/nitrite transporter NarK [Kytococcus aerolatus]